MEKRSSDTKLYQAIIELLQLARNQIVNAVNTTMVVTYFEIGRMIVEEEEQGQDRAAYGKQLLKELSKVLTQEFGKGYSVTNIQQMRMFYNSYRKQQTLSATSEAGLLSKGRKGFHLMINILE